MQLSSASDTTSFSKARTVSHLDRAIGSSEILGLKNLEFETEILNFGFQSEISNFTF